MKAVLKIEFQRLFRSVTFYISLGIGLILTMTQFVMVGLQESMHILDAYSPKGISEPYGVFSSYFGMAGPPLVYRHLLSDTSDTGGICLCNDILRRP